MQTPLKSAPSRIRRTGPALWLFFLAALLLIAGERTDLLESWYYDFLQRQHQSQGSDRIVILSTDRADGSTASIWDADRFTAVAGALNAAGVELIVPVEPPPSSSALPDVGQLSALVELERRVRQMDERDAGQSGNDIDSLTQQLANIRKQYERQAQMAKAVKQAGNVILALSVATPAGNDSPVSAACARWITAVPNENTLAAIRTAGLIMPADDLCTAARQLGFIGFRSDPDGVIRNDDLLVRTSAGVFGSLAYAAALEVPESPLAAMAGLLTAGTPVAAQSSGFTFLTRYYAGTNGQPAFKRIAVDALLAGDIAKSDLQGRIVLIGGTRSGSYMTPLGTSAATADLVATRLSNLLLQDALSRPRWLAVLEPALLILAGLLLLVWLPVMSTTGSALAALFLTMILLTTEVYLLIALGIWAKLVTVALFTLLGTGSLHIMRGLWSPASKKSGAANTDLPGHGQLSDEDELDLAFSVLRQQEDSEETKRRLYKIAMIHGRRKEFAKAERVFQYLASLDPDYADVSEKLTKLSGAVRKKSGEDEIEAQASAEPADDSSSEPASPIASADGSGKQFMGRYEVLEKIGQGAMATVYLGRDPKINRKVAIKTIALADEFSAEDLAATKTQFMREAESAGRLNHPNIIAIYDVGEDNDVAYLAMEYFEGDALNHHATEGSLLPAKWVLELMARAADALHYAHGQNVVHRDIKPANIMYHAGKDELKITDFGIARLTDTSRTKTGIILGTPSYMSPEQLAASSVTGQSDLYSLGITMYQLLCGQVPFQADSIPQLMDKIANMPPAPVTQQREDLPACIDPILERVLAKMPEDRFANGRTMALALRDCVESFPV